MEKKRHGAAGKMAVGLSALAVAALAAVGYHFSYPIDAGMDHFAAEADRWLRRGQTETYEYDIQMYDPLTLGSLTYIPFDLDGEI